MVSSKQLRHMMRHPAALMKFQATGQAPRVMRPASPLIALLDAINPGDRVRIKGVRIDAGLGYEGSRDFHTAEQALRWVRPDAEMIEGTSWPAESWRNKRFRDQVYLEELLDRALSYPQDMTGRYPMLSWAGPSNPGGRLFKELARSQLAVDNNRVEHEGRGVYRFSGNFSKMSHVFNFRTSVPEVVTPLCEAIFENRARADYVADVAYREAAALEYHAGLEATGNMEAFREAKREWAQFRPVKGRFVHGQQAGVPEQKGE